jgi:hypothetical protein
MNDSSSSGIEAADLQRRLHAVEPAALLVPSRVLRRIIKQHGRVPAFGLQVPHRRSYVVGCDALFGVVDRAELGLPSNYKLPTTVILLARPDPETLAATSRDITLLKYWRMLFHARVHVDLEKRVSEDCRTLDGIRTRMSAIGAAAFEEIRNVLTKDEYLLYPEDDRSVFIEFAAVYLELRYFAPSLLPHYFPALDRLDRIDNLLAADINADGVFAATRLEGAPDPVVPDYRSVADFELLPEQDTTSPRDRASPRRFNQLQERARRADLQGNVVRAAIALTLADRISPLKRTHETPIGADAELMKLAARLQAVVGLDSQDTAQWCSVLRPLLQPAARGVWPLEARLLYDLQKACIDHERELFAVDLAHWGLSLGSRPVKRPVPCQSAVLSLRHLRLAARRARRARLADEERQRLSGMLSAAVRHVEAMLRSRFRPLIQDTLDRVGFQPENLPERVAQHKLIEEILDLVVERGFVTMSDLRDALSRNNLKLPDLGGAEEFFLGDRLIQANRRLARSLDGVYRRGEIYLRWLQRFSALAFGTFIGRLLTLFLVLPYGGAFVALEGIQHLVGFVVPSAHHAPVEPSFDDLESNNGPVHAHSRHPPPIRFMTVWSVVVLGTFLLALLHIPSFRRTVGQALWLLYRGARALLLDFPRFILGLPLVQKILASRLLQLFTRFVMRPLAMSILTWVALWYCGVEAEAAFLVSGGVFLVAFILWNTRLGRELEEAVIDWLIDLWQRVQFNLIPGLFRLVMGFFKWVLETLDRLLYRVDEWLRFRAGESRLALCVKAVLGLVWFVLTYIVRFFILVLAEPQINPIKHFPVVTVSHKLVLGLFFPPFYRFLATQMERGLARTVAVTVSTAIPGFFGFLVWELKENWRLYRANQSRTLRPDVIGSHGETMLRLLQPGIHSGTLPKLYAKLRKAERAGQRTGDWSAARKHRETLHHVEESIGNFVNREFAYLINECQGLGELHLTTGSIRAATNRIHVELCCPQLGQQALVVVFEEIGGRLIARVSEPGWLSRLTQPQLQVVANALAGFYKMAGVDLVRHQCDDGFFAGDLTERSSSAPQFKDWPISWQDWVESWQPEHEPKGTLSALADGFHLLPTKVVSQKP